jgi:hypothetical protein
MEREPAGPVDDHIRRRGHTTAIETHAQPTRRRSQSVVGPLMTSRARTRRYLRSGDQHYIIGEKLRAGSAEAQAALSRQDRYQDVAANLPVKEVRVAGLPPLANIDGTYGRAIRNIGRPVVRAAGRSAGRRRAARPPRPRRGGPR